MTKNEAPEFVEWSFNGRTAKLAKKWKDLTEWQKKVLEKNFPIWVVSHILIFFVPWIFLLYARQYWIRIWMLLAGLIWPLQLILRIIVIIYWKDLCYNGESPNMKNNLVANKEARDNKEWVFNDNVKLSNIWVSNFAFYICIIPVFIVILWIMSAALLPTLQWSQWAARDAARRADLNQLWSAILSYYNNEGKYPWASSATIMIPISKIKDELFRVVEMSYLPSDPNTNNSFVFNGETIENGQYWYIVLNGWKKYALMANTETVWWSNFVYNWKSNSNIEKLCTSFKEWDRASNINWVCTYSSKDQLRYVYVF